MNKKDIAKLFSFLAITISTILLVLLSSGSFNKPDQILKPTNAWAYFPLNQSQTIDFDIEQNSFNQLTDREKEEQLRDWLLLTIASDKNFSANDINNSLYSLSPIRYGYLKPVSNFEYGDTRSFSIGNGKIVALLPKVISQQEKLNNLASIADKYRKNLGKKPTKIEVFEYDIQSGQKQALLTRTEELNTEEIFTNNNKEYGYSEATVTTLKELETFLKQIDDLTFAQVNDSSLKLGGRKIGGYSSGGIKIEDIAAIWQSEKKIQQQPDKFKVNGSGFSLDPDFDYKSLRSELEKVKPLLQSLKLNDQRLISDDDIKKAQEGLSQKDVNPYKKLIIKKLEKNLNNESVFRPFFEKEIRTELEPYIKQRKQKIKQEISQYENQLKQEAKKELKQQVTEEIKLAQKSGQSAEQIKINLDSIIQTKQSKIIEIQEQKFKKFQLIVNEKETAQNKRLINNKIENKINTIDRFLVTPSSQSFQSARYDGDLQGTEVGMVLFYTDLLAKIWALDYLNAVPSQYISEFQPLTQKSAKISSLYTREIKELPNTRLWFGHQDKGFQVANNKNSILFSRNATRIYAASSDSLNGKETTAAADSEAFLGWWNDHYDEVARYEPQYERLNQIMKSSLLVSWLNESGNGKLLDFLQDVKVKHDYWFPDWVEVNKKDLKFTDWTAQPCQGTWQTDPNKPKKPICFYKKGYKGQKTETMPLLTSVTFKQFGKNGRYLTGGVSLADQSLFQKRVSLPESPEISEVSLSSEIDYSSIKLDGKNTTFKTLDETTHSLKTVNPFEAHTTTKAKEGTKFRSPNIELNNLPISRKIVHTNESVEINTAVNNVDLNNLNITRIENGFSIGLISRDIDLGRGLVSDLNNSKKNPEDFLTSHPQIQSIAKNSNIYYVKLENSQNWLELKLDLKLDLAGGGSGGKDPPNRPPWFYMEHEKGSSQNGQDKGSGGNGGGNGGRELAGNGDAPSDDGKVWVLAWFKQKEIDKLFSDGSVKCTKGPCHTQGTKDNNAYQTFSYELKTGNDLALAQKLADNPQEFHQHQKKYFKNKIKEINNNIAKDKFDLALGQIDKLIEKYGKTPTLMTKKALILVAKEKINFEQMLIGTEPTKTFSKTNFLDEIKLLITNNTKFKGIMKDNTLIYVQDSPGLNNLDWNQPIANTVLFTSGKQKTYRLQNGGNGGNGGNGKGSLGTMGFGDDDFNEEIKFLGSFADYEQRSGSDPFTGQRFYSIHSGSDNSDCLNSDANNNKDTTSEDQCIKQNSSTENSDRKPQIYIVFEKTL
jgi:hypothetical protein